VNQKKPTLSEIDDLRKQLGEVFVTIEAQIDTIEKTFNTIEQDFMYSNIYESVYYEKMAAVCREIDLVRDRLAKIGSLKNSS
jgi:hypothetical protein